MPIVPQGALMALQELRNYNRLTYEHCLRVGFYAFWFTKSGVGTKILTEARITDKNMFLASVLHDIGKLDVSVDVLSDSTRFADMPCSRRAQALGAVRVHSAAGENQARKLHLDPCVATLIGSHHERFDGSGYPRGLAGKQVKTEMQLLGMLDVFSALTEERPYRAPKKRSAAIGILRDEAERGLWARRLAERVLPILASLAYFTGQSLGEFETLCCIERRSVI